MARKNTSSNTSRSSSRGTNVNRRDTSGKFKTTITKSPTERIESGEKVPKYIKNTGKDWTEKDIKQLRDLIKINTPTRVIGMKLSRSESSVRSKAKSLGLSLKPVNKSPHTRSR